MGEQRGDEQRQPPRCTHFCRSLSIGGYDDWYLPATQEWDILYRAFKPQVTGSGSYFGESYGANPYAVPQAGNYTETNPARTSRR